jgi:uncharacterized protein (UPF0332 family)
MTDNNYGKDLAFYKLERAKDEIESAELLFDHCKYKAANNRAYYAIYYTLTAVLCLEPISFKKHKDTIAYFNKNYVHKGLFSNELGRKISKAEKIRNASDYNDFYIAGKEDASGQIETAKEVVQAVEIFLNKHTDDY